jgi:hypothetical protein
VKPHKSPRPWPRLTQSAPVPLSADGFDACQLCGGDDASLWYECDDHDRSELDRVLAVCARRACSKIVRDHPRLYVAVERGEPGHFPQLCGPCRHRQGSGCTHADLKANGGAGLTVSLDHLPGIICSRGRGGGCRTAPYTAVACAGREVEPAPEPTP